MDDENDVKFNWHKDRHFGHMDAIYFDIHVGSMLGNYE